MKKEKLYTREDVQNIINKRIAEEMENKNRYIELNGYSHKDTLQCFDSRIAALCYLLYDFDKYGRKQEK